jgi:hypothetical protein
MQMQMQKQKQKQVTLLPLMLWCANRRDNIRREQSRDPKNGPKGSPSTASWSGLIVQVPHIDAKSRIEGWVGSQPLSKASRMVPEAKAKRRHQGSGHPSVCREASKQEGR